MAFKSPLWRPVALVLAALNLVGVGFAAATTEPLHAAVHATLALVFGLWAQRLRKGSGGSEPMEERMAALEEALEGEVGKLRQELNEAQERLDFAERLLAQGQEARRMGPRRDG
jgi:hypothetical protein